MRAHNLILAAVVAALLAFAASCSVLGIATEDYVEARVDAVDEARVETAAAIVSPLEPLVPGITEYARNTAKDVHVAPPPPPDTEIPLWVQAALAALGVPVSVGATNYMRNRARRQRGEALTPAEAAAKGYYEDGTKPTGETA